MSVCNELAVLTVAVLIAIVDERTLVKCVFLYAHGGKTVPLIEWHSALDKISKAGTHALMSMSGSEYLCRERLPNCFVECADQLRELAI